MAKRRTQAERRAETYKQVLDSATRLFGEKGYANTSVDDVASACGLTTRPIYHYFGNKKSLFAAVAATMDERVVAVMDPGQGGAAFIESWTGFLNLCEDPAFRQIALVDSPNILGRDRWASSTTYARARRQIAAPAADDQSSRYRAELLWRMTMGALAEAALMVAEAEDQQLAREQAEGLVRDIAEALPGSNLLA